MPKAPDLDARADEWAGELLALLSATLPGEHSVAIERQPPRYVVHTSSRDGERIGHVPLRIKGRNGVAAWFFVSMSLRPDRTGRYLAVASSALVLKGLDRKPLVRLEFLDDAKKVPCCHWQFHGESLPFQELLKATRPTSKAATRLSALHFPVGGARMRPGIEDFLQFVIQECGFEGVAGWRTAVNQSRSTWRVRQAKTIVRDAPRAVAAALSEHLGVRVLRLARLSKTSDEGVGHTFTRW